MFWDIWGFLCDPKTGSKLRNTSKWVYHLGRKVMSKRRNSKIWWYEHYIQYTMYQSKTLRPWFQVLIGYSSLHNDTRIKSKVCYEKFRKFSIWWALRFLKFDKGELRKLFLKFFFRSTNDPFYWLFDFLRRVSIFVQRQKSALFLSPNPLDHPVSSWFGQLFRKCALIVYN